MQLERIKPKFEDLEKISLGQEVIIKNEGVMRFVGTRACIDDEVEVIDGGYNPVFLSKIINDNEIKYKEVEILTKCNSLAIYKEIIEKDNKNYNYVKEIWRNLN